MYSLLTSTDDEYESGFGRNQDIAADHAAAPIVHMYMMVKMRVVKLIIKDFIWFRIETNIKK